MLLVLNRNSVTINRPLLQIEISKKYYDYFINRKVELLLLGYPFDTQSYKWLTAAQIAEFYQKDNDNFYDHLDGLYSIIIRDLINEKLSIIIDPFKSYTLYYYLDESQFVLSDSIISIREHVSKVDINKNAIIEFMHFGYVLGDKTIFKKIKTFEPGSEYILNKGLSLQKKQYHMLLNNNHNKSIADFIYNFNSHMENGLRLEEKISLPLTGGLDSRTILSGALPSKNKLHCFTHGLKKSDDVRIARNICRSFKIDYAHYDLDTDDNEFITRIPLIANGLTDFFDGMLNTFLFAHMTLSIPAESKYCQMMLPGVGGELYRYYFLPKHWQKITSIDELTVSVRIKLELPSNKTIYTEFRQNQINDILDEGIYLEFKKYKKDDFTQLVQKFYLKNRIGNFASYAIKYFSTHFKIFAPFLSKKLIQSIPMISDDKMHGGEILKSIIKHNCPQLAFIPMDGGRLITKTISTRIQRELWHLGKEINRKTKGKLFANNCFDYGKWLTIDHKDIVLKNMLDNNINYIFDKEKMKELGNAFINGDLQFTYFITNIFSLSQIIE